MTDTEFVQRLTAQTKTGSIQWDYNRDWTPEWYNTEQNDCAVYIYSANTTPYMVIQNKYAGNAQKLAVEVADILELKTAIDNYQTTTKTALFDQFFAERETNG